MFPDFKELLSVFNAGRVRYLFVGGYAVSFHSQPRATKDLDILVDPSPENSVALFEALVKFGASVGRLTPRDFADPENSFRMGTPPAMVDILPRIKGVEFAKAWERRVLRAVGPDLTVPFISRGDRMPLFLDPPDYFATGSKPWQAEADTRSTMRTGWRW
jgi:hypothetical protein